MFGTLGVIGFGGPAAHIALMRREVVERRAWLSDQHLADLIGITNLLPGPNSTELALHLGMQRAGWRGLLVAGVAFIVPAVLIVLALAWAYVTYGSTPTGTAFLYGIKPVVVVIVAFALVGLLRSVIREPLTAALAVAVALLWTAGINELVLLAIGSVVVAIARGLPGGWLAAGVAVPGAAAVSTTASGSLPLIAAVFLKAGALLFGSGYVLLAYLRGDLVERLGWLTDAQLLDAVAVGQVTPGPFFTTATFVGYLLAGVPGALTATVAIFLPAFVLVALVAPHVGRLRDRPLTAALLDGVTAASLGLMAAVSFVLAGDAIVDPVTGIIAVATAGALLWGRVPSVVLILAGAAIGLVSLNLIGGA